VIDPNQAVSVLIDEGVTLFTGVPDSLLKGFNTAISMAVGARHIVAANEGAAVGIAAGHYVATGSPAVVYLQNSGLGNAINPLTSLTPSDVYGIPVVLVIGWRGRPGTTDAPQHLLQGRVTAPMLDLLHVTRRTIDSETADWQGEFRGAVRDAISQSSPSAILIAESVFSTLVIRADKQPSDLLPSRAEVIDTAVRALDRDTIFVSTTGHTSRDLNAVRKEYPGPSRDFMVVGSMGHALSIALGVAIDRPGDTVVCLDGDGAMAMHMGAMTSVGQQAPNNLIHLLLDNGIHESVGGQPSSLAGANPIEIARGCGYAESFRASGLDQLSLWLSESAEGSGPRFVHVPIASHGEAAKDRPSDLKLQMRRLRESMGDGT
jgi:phosphonopyruvate decarboxylase